MKLRASLANSLSYLDLKIEEESSRLILNFQIKIG